MDKETGEQSKKKSKYSSKQLSQTRKTITKEEKKNLWNLIVNEGKPIKEASEELSINYGSALKIIAKERKRIKDAANAGEINVEKDDKLKNYINRKRNNISDDIKKKLWELTINQGKPMKEAAENLAINKESVKRIIYNERKKIKESLNIGEINGKTNGNSNENGIQLYVKKPKEYKIKLLELVIDQGKSIKEAVEQLSVNFRTAETIVYRERKRLRQAVAAGEVNTEGNDHLVNFINKSVDTIGEDAKKDLYELVINQGKTIKEASEQLCIGYGSAKKIIAKERKKIEEATVGVEGNNVGDGKRNNVATKPADKISNDTKKQLWELVVNQGKPMKEAASMMSLKYNTAMKIIYREKKKLNIDASAGNISVEENELNNFIDEACNRMNNEIKNGLQELVEKYSYSQKQASKLLGIIARKATTILSNEKKKLKGANNEES
ncbi:hypothetical protein K502DRAFT_324936 [Neoconidiobolus thromboides FSU 785]|nr:hypothetical protein K502DRAFT_324936 [Neoconidiobolus thromboides FSU 785]